MRVNLRHNITEAVVLEARFFFFLALAGAAGTVCGAAVLTRSPSLFSACAAVCCPNNISSFLLEFARTRAFSRLAREER